MTTTGVSSAAGRSSPTAPQGTIVVAGALAQKAGQGGHAWVLLQYLLGFRRLGWEVLFVDRLAPATADWSGSAGAAQSGPGLRYVADVMRQFGLAGAFTVLLGGSQTFGLPRAAVLERVRRSALLLNVMGFLEDQELLEAAPRRVFLDIDPGFGQMWQALGLCETFKQHDAYVTIGQNIDRPGCAIPTCGLTWITTPPPVVLEEWPVEITDPAGRPIAASRPGGVLTARSSTAAGPTAYALMNSDVLSSCRGAAGRPFGWRSTSILPRPGTWLRWPTTAGSWSIPEPRRATRRPTAPTSVTRRPS